MKGLNCYARFVDDPGIEKFPILDRGKSNFLRPVTLSLSQQGPFIQLTVAVPGCWALTPRPSAAPVTLPFFPPGMVRGGRARLEVSPGRVPLRAFRFFRQCLIYFTVRSGPGLLGSGRFLGEHGDI